MDSPNYRMIAIDLDGTLLDPSGQVTERTRHAIHDCLAAGLLICFATGRNWTESRTIIEAVGHFDTAVFVGGAIVMDTKQQITLHRTLMDARLAAEVCQVIESRGHCVLALQDTGATGVDYLVTADVPMDPQTEQWMKATRSVVHRVARLAQHPHPHTMRVGIVSTSAEVAELNVALFERFAERIFTQVVRLAHLDAVVLEVFDPSVNKWQGILHVAQRHGISPAEVIAIGDDLNDLHMIRNAGHGVAMGNAHPDVRKLARQVIGSNREEGLAIYLETILRGKIVRPENGASEAAA